MVAARHVRKTEPHPNSRDERGESLRRAGFTILLAVIALRPMLPESHSSARTGVLAALTEVEHIGPGVTVVLNAAIFLAAILAALATWRSGCSGRRMGVEWPMLLVCLAALVSCLVASNRRVALISATDWGLMLGVGPILFQLLRSNRQVRVVVCVILATAGAFAVQCVLQKTTEFDDTVAQYERTREQMWSSRGIELDEPQVQLFERRLYAREVHGFGAHSNVAGGYLAMCALAGVGLAWSKLYGPALPMRRGFGVLSACIVALIGLPVFWSASKGAMTAGAIAAMLVVAILCSRFARSRPRTAWRLGWAGAAVIAAGVVGHGWYHGGLPGASLNFRWHYWSNTAEMIQDHPLAGVGMDNFGKNYLRYRPITSPEEISDPHNVFVRAAAEWGLPGAAAMLWLVVAGSRAIVLSRESPRPNDLRRAGPRMQDLHPWRIGVLITATIAFGKGAAEGFISPSFWIVSALTPALTWLILYACLILDTNRLDGPPDDHPTGLGIWLGGAAAAFAIHNLVSFSWFVAGTGTVFMAMVAVAVFLRNPLTSPVEVPEPTAKLRYPRAALAALGVLATGFLLGVMLPTLRTGTALSAARRAVADGRPDAAVRAYDRAARADSLDPVPSAEAARFLVRVAGSSPNGAIQSLGRALILARQARQRDPVDSACLLLEAQILDRRYVLGDNLADAQGAVRATRQATERNPSEPRLYEVLGDQLAKLAQATGSIELRAETSNAYQTALDLDAARPSEEIRRFAASRIERIRAKRDQFQDK